ALPALRLVLVGPDLNKSRLLYLPSVGFCIFLATLLDGLRGKVRLIIPGVILSFHVAALEHNLAIWKYAAAKAKSTPAIAARCVGPGIQRIVVACLPGTIRGVPCFANGFEEADQLEPTGSAGPVVVVTGSRCNTDA